MVSEEYDYDDALGDLFCEIGFTYTREGNNKNNRTICWDFWRGLSQWTKEQAVYLLCGIEPHDADFEKMPDVIVKIQLKAFDDLKVEIAPPFVWLRWFNDSGMFELENTSRELSVWYNEQLAEKKLAGDLLLDDSSENRTTTMRPKKTSIYKDRDNDCRAWIESKNPPLDKMTMKQIHECLKKRDAMRDRFHKLWQSGFRGWWEYQTLIKLTSGRKKQRRGQYEC